MIIQSSVAGSTHPTEEEKLFEAFTEVQKEFPRARLLIAPRKPGRTHEITRLAERFGLTVGLRSVLRDEKGQRPRYPVILIDTIGELGRIYAVGDVVLSAAALSTMAGTMSLNRRLMPNPSLWVRACQTSRIPSLF